MNLTRFMPNFGKTAVDENTPFDKLPQEEQDRILAEERAERIKFTRDHVRNGPQRSRRPLEARWLSAGRSESRARRAHKAFLAKANRNHRQDFIRAQRDLSRLRGQLEVVGALPVSRGHIEEVGSWEQTDLKGHQPPEWVVRDVVKTTEHFVDAPVAAKRNALRGLYDGYGAVVQATLDETGAGELDFDDLDHRDLVVGAALHHYRLATRSAA